jgi:hypothetical protein
MPKRSDYDDFSDDELEFIDEYGEQELRDLYDLLEEFPEFDDDFGEDRFEDLLNYDDEDFYSKTGN